MVEQISEQNLNSTLSEAVAARRTFAIISHPDAGKTTLTEKLLLYGNAIELAGNVRARKNQRSTTSDWMEMERERGISISSTVLQFPYKNCLINLLDTPGHQDFSEDTYRTLSAVDSAVMVLDAAKGIEPQTRKLFDVCRKRGIPVFTFINKMDRPSRDPLELLDEIQSVLKMEPVPVNWPLGDGPEFAGVYSREEKGVYLFDRTERNERISPEHFVPLANLHAVKAVSAKRIQKLEEDLELLDGLGIEFDQERVMAGEQTPVFYGSALTNFGVRQFLDAFITFAPPPQPYKHKDGVVDPFAPGFSGFIFKIQANMNPKHRDSVAFLRICSGKFERGVSVIHAQSGKTMRLARPYKVFANEREVIDDAYPGDILGLPNTGDFAIGDTLTTEPGLQFEPLPRFTPEHFAMLHIKDISKQKQFQKGLHQLEAEGAIQVFYNTNAFQRAPILGVVGQLQFDVAQSRLLNEYNVATDLERLNYTIACLVKGPEHVIDQLPIREDYVLVRDSSNRQIALFSSPFYIKFFQDKFPELQFVPYHV